MAMTFEQLQKQWLAIKITPYTRSELRTILFNARKARFKKLKDRLTVELLFSLWLLTSAMIILKVFSGSDWLTLVVAGSTAQWLISFAVGRHYLGQPMDEELYASMVNLSQQMKLLLTATRLANVVMSAAMLTLLVYRTGGDRGPVFAWEFLAPVMFSILSVASRPWLRRLITLESLTRLKWTKSI